MPPTEFPGFVTPVDPRAEELRAWAYHPDSVPLAEMPPSWDLLIATNRLVETLFELAADPRCPARRFALHCLYIYAAGGVRTGFREQSRRKLHGCLKRAEQHGDEPMRTWAHNTRTLLERPDLFAYRDWYEGNLVRNPRRIG